MSTTPRTRALLRKLASLPPDHRDENLVTLINEELRGCSVEEIEHIRDRVRFTCGSSADAQVVVNTLQGLIDVKRMGL